MPVSRPLLTSAVWLLLATHVMAQSRNAPQPRRPAEPPPTCLVSEFRAMALGTHDLGERGKKAVEWLQRNGPACSEDQLRLLNNNRTSWLGNADSMQLMSMIDGALESRLKNKPEQLARMFGATPPAPPEGNDTVRSGTMAPRPAPVVAPGTPAVVTAVVPPVVVGAPGTVPGGAPPGLMPPGAVPPGAMPPGAIPPGAMPPGAMPPGAARPPEVGRHFGDRLRSAIREYFTANRGSGPCPEGLILKEGRCESSQANRAWKLGQPLPSLNTPKEPPARLLERLGPAPADHRYVLVDGDLLLINTSTQTVIDAVLDLGQVPPRT